MSTLKYQVLMDYFDYLVEQHHVLETSVGFSKQELHNSLGKLKGKKYPLLALYGYEGKLKGPQQRTLAIRTISFSVVFGGIAINDIKKQYKAIADSEEYGLQILSRINYDSKTVKSGHWLYRNFNKESVEFSELRTDTEAALYGMDFSFDLVVSEPLVLVGSHWKDEKKLC